eukprot:CAMPEP_0183294578 /NCGR_PEP_ID=MMETSP0160_2-20130417/2864_1 /TAXON_ID=2839 ORGANISM="Odontella Sinensis, Strain Grunow 1884" /NCGR_SAMPLE_ID=MMETSP0160_2 /ASSEMBLY_ACC=CAM_ASM_000250 /LENGTH=256 /DNA_ID=CAMNT_0025455927 /DNA_START=85 /DNA_END=855 /DNA_ORIENTATION=+
MRWGASGLKNKDLIASLSEQIENHNTVSFLTKEDEDDVTEVMARSFINDPLFNWMSNVDEAKPNQKELILDLNRWIFKFTNGRALRRKKGVVIGAQADGSLAGAMTIVPHGPNTSDVDFFSVLLSIIKMGLPPIYKKGTKGQYGPMAVKRMDSLEILGKRKKEHMKKHSRWIFLSLVGVLHEHQGKGVGSSMFRALFRSADALNVPVYLQTESKENESLYQRYGFRTLENLEIIAPGDTQKDAKLPMYLMVRDSLK